MHRNQPVVKNYICKTPYNSHLSSIRKRRTNSWNTHYYSDKLLSSCLPSKIPKFYTHTRTHTHTQMHARNFASSFVWQKHEVS